MPINLQVRIIIAEITERGRERERKKRVRKERERERGVRKEREKEWEVESDTWDLVALSTIAWRS